MIWYRKNFGVGSESSVMWSKVDPTSLWIGEVWNELVQEELWEFDWWFHFYMRG